MLNSLLVWIFVGGLPPFLSPLPCPSPTPSLSETLKALGEGKLVGGAVSSLRKQFEDEGSALPIWVQKLKHLAISFADLKIHSIVVL